MQKLLKPLLNFDDRIMRYLQYTILILMLASCSVGSSPEDPTASLVDKLKGQGPTPLNAENPYIASNLLISREMERSPEMKGFVDHRGAPAAIEVEQGYFSPVNIHFYYMDKREQYIFEKLDNVWAIRGPFEIEPKKMTQVRLETRGVSGVPTFGETEKVEEQEPKNMGDPEDPVVDALNRIAQQREKAAAEQGFKSPSVEANPNAAVELAEESSSRITDYQSELDREAANENEKGDILHTISSADETLEILAYWYTHDRGNTGRIERINKLTGMTVSQGTTIRIPSYLVKSRLLPNEQDVGVVQEMITGS